MKKARINRAFQTNQQKCLLVFVVSNRFATSANITNCRTQNADFNAVSNFCFQFVIINHFGYFSENAATSNDCIVAADISEHFCALFHLSTLRADNQEIHNHKNKNERQNAHQHIRAESTATGGLTPRQTENCLMFLDCRIP